MTDEKFRALLTQRMREKGVPEVCPQADVWGTLNRNRRFYGPYSANRGLEMWLDDKALHDHARAADVAVDVDE